ncbi:thioredoxin-like protein, partial [Zopfochytrium polystomum]
MGPKKAAATGKRKAEEAAEGEHHEEEGVATSPSKKAAASPAAASESKRTRRGAAAAAPAPVPTRTSARKAKTDAKAKVSKAAAADDDDEEEEDGDTGGAAQPATKKRAAAPKKKDDADYDDDEGDADDGDGAASAAAGAAKKLTKALAANDVLPASLPVANLHDGTTADLNEISKTHGIVIFVYPKANTPGCTNQACGYRDSHDEFAQRGFKVFGLSADSPKSLTTWKEKYNLPYSFISDKERVFLKAFGVNKSATQVHRSHIVIAKGGKVLHIKKGVSAKPSAAEALELI